MENSEELDLSLFDLSIDPDSQSSLDQASRWAKFLSIVLICAGVIVFLFLIIGGISSSRALYRYGISSDGSLYMVIVFIVMAILSVYIIFLMRFSIFTTKGLRENSQSDLEKGIGSLKVYIILIAAYSILVLVAGLFGLLR